MSSLVSPDAELMARGMISPGGSPDFPGCLRAPSTEELEDGSQTEGGGMNNQTTKERHTRRHVSL